MKKLTFILISIALLISCSKQKQNLYKENSTQFQTATTKTTTVEKTTTETKTVATEIQNVSEEFSSNDTEKIFDTLQPLEVNKENLSGDWFLSNYSDDYMNYSRQVLIFKDSEYMSGLYESSACSLGKYSINKNEITYFEEAIPSDNDELEKSENIYKDTVLELTDIKLKIQSRTDKNSDSEPLVYYKSVPLNSDSSDSEWIQYIKKYGNRKILNEATLFMYAVYCGKNDVALFLINFGVDKNDKDCFGNTAADYYLKSEYSEKISSEVKKFLSE